MLHKELATGMGMKDKNVFVLSNGSVLELDRDSAAVTGKCSGRQNHWWTDSAWEM